MPEISWHTVTWVDGLKVTRVLEARGQMILWLTWKGVKREVRLGRRVSEIRRVKEKST